MELILDEIIESIRPTKEDLQQGIRIYEKVVSLIKNEDVEPILVGSIAKGTDLRKNRDIDIFIQFRTDVSRADLEKNGLRIGRRVFKLLGVPYTIDYAEHPYVKGEFEGHTIEIVPCYKTDALMSAVDRTPHHTKFVLERIEGNDLNDQIRLLKQFMRGLDVYGAEAKVEGFSGYLAEILVISYGSFKGVIEAAHKWQLPKIIDVGGTWTKPQVLKRHFPHSKLIVIDPVDKGRNVAAAVSPASLSRFIIGCDLFLNSPSRDFFFPPEKKTRPKQEILSKMRERGTKFYAIEFTHGKINENTLYSQLRKTLKHMEDEISRNEFICFTSSFWTDETSCSIILFEMELDCLPNLIHHIGPPIDLDATHQERFTSKYIAEKPYIKDGRWVVDAKRRYVKFQDLLAEMSRKKDGFGKNLRELETPKIHLDEDILSIADDRWNIHLCDLIF